MLNSQLTKENTSNLELVLMMIPFFNLLLIVVSNVLVAWTWYKIVTAEGDTMFLGLFLIPLALVTLYYLALLKRGFKLVRQRVELKDKRLGQALVLFLLNTIPMSLIYYFTT